MRHGYKAIELIKRFEGLELVAYKCPAGIWTIGYGHTGDVVEGSSISKIDAEKLLDKDLVVFTENLNSLNLKLNQDQFDALISFIYNIGFSAFKRSTMLKHLSLGEYEKAADQFARWTKSNGKVLQGLIRRRQAEKQLFVGGEI